MLALRTHPVNDDGALLAQVRSEQSDEAFGTLVKRYRDFVYGICLNEIGDVEVASEATGATFVLLRRSARLISTRKPLAPWLMTAALHVSRNARRDEGKTLASRPARLNGQPEAVMARLRRARDKDRLLLSLHYLNGMSVRQMALALGTPEATAQQGLQSGFNRLRNALSGDGVSLTDDDLNRILSSQLTWEGPEIQVAANADHRWATRVQKTPRQRLLVAARRFSITALVLVMGLPSLLMAFHQVPASPYGVWKTWHMVFAGASGSGSTYTRAGVWEGPEGVGSAKPRLEVFHSLDGETFNIQYESITSSGDGGPDGVSVSHIGRDWQLNGHAAVAQGGEGFRWDQGDLVLTADTDRSTERLTVHAAGAKLNVVFERGGSVESLKPRFQFDGGRAPDGTTP